MTDEMNTEKDAWYWGKYGDGYYPEPCATPEEALESAKLNLKKETEIYVAYFELVERKPSQFIKRLLDDILDEINDCFDQDNQFFYGIGPFHCSSEEIESFDIALKTAADKWQKDHDLEFCYYKPDESSKKYYLVNPKTSIVKVLHDDELW